LAAGAAVVAERLPAFEEALGSHALWTDPDPAEIATRLEAALSSSREQEARTARRAHAATFTWDRCAQATLAAWRSALAAGPPR
jgi:glycosyltransferase involved in cell wall biosynthesis